MKIQVNVFVDVRKWEMLWSAGLCSALSHSTLDGRGSYLFRTSLVPSSLHFSLPSSCVAVVLVSTATFLSRKSPTIMLPAVLLPSCGGMYVRAFSSPFNISTCAFLCFPSPFLVFISPFLHLSPSHFFLLSPCSLEAGMHVSSLLGPGVGLLWGKPEEEILVLGNKSHCRAEPFSDNCLLSVNRVHF